jgi:hypothetical protein
MRDLMAFLKRMVSDDNGMPSSSRVIGIMIFTLLVVSVGSITGVFLWKLYWTQDANVVKILVEGINKFSWFYMILAATALSLYGINVWKYIAQIKSGGIMGGGSSINDSDADYSKPLKPSGVTGLPPSGVPSTQAIKIPIQTGRKVAEKPHPVPPPVKTSIPGQGSDD